MRGVWGLLFALLGGCQADASTLEQEVTANLAKQDYRLIVIAGRGEFAPGIAAELQAETKARCGVRYLDGLGDVIRPGQQEMYAKLSAYANEYNRQMLEHCLPPSVSEQ
ncbi:MULTISPECIES: hypothetical protein [Aeromonas]|jgi:hypothetical protein|uniref:hypothetical protein n=1 Tax=Aeromonas TaxID=642 RepID=UPI001119C1E8|nr:MULTISPECIES: hypothetical protein [Aeromonas]MCX7128219.1 hypothetical protein [Aeromonas sp.]TNI86654.1 hypothetical protein CF119_07740 [Aeromonas sobria]